MLERFRAGGRGSREGRQVLAYSLSAAGHAGILALAALIPRPVPPEHAPFIVTVSLHSVVEPAAEEDAGRATGDLAGPAGAGSSPAVEERAPPLPPRVEPRPPPPAPPPEPEASEPEEPPARTVPAERTPVVPTLAFLTELESTSEPAAPTPEPEAASIDVDATGSPDPAADLEAGEGAGAAPSGGDGGFGSGPGGGEGEGRGGRRGKKQRASKEAEVLPALVHCPKPPYPARSRDLGEEGTVIIAILVDEKGRVRDATVATSSGHPLLDGSALATVRQKWRFRPGRSAGAQVARWVRVPVEFRIRRR